MNKHRVRYRSGLTLVELVTTLTIVPIVVLSVGFLLVDGQKGWSKTYDHVNDGLASDGYAAARAFESIVRKATSKRHLLDNGQLYVYYYNDPNSSTILDRYAKFYSENGNFIVDYGVLDTDGNPQSVTSSLPLAYNFQTVDFYVSGASIQMILQLDDVSDTLTVMTSAIRRNR